MPKIKEGTPRTKRNRAKRPSKASHVPAMSSKSGRHWSPKATLIAGAAGVAAGAAGTAAILMRREIREHAAQAAIDATLASRAFERFGKRLLRRRPSLLSRVFSPIGIVAGLVAAAGSAIFLMAPKPFATSQRPPKPERGEGTLPSPGPGAESPSDLGVTGSATEDVIVKNGATYLAGS
jgi:hypothetical protein